MATYEGLRQAAARLIGSSPREIAIVKNTSEGIAMVATGIELEVAATGSWRSTRSSPLITCLGSSWRNVA